MQEDWLTTSKIVVRGSDFSVASFIKSSYHLEYINAIHR